jgi:hypothetical protein
MGKTCTIGKHGVQKRLEEELERLKQATGPRQDLRLRWVPDSGSKLSGEVRDGTVYVYEENETKALQTLRHEFLDHLVSQAIEPYKSVTNALIKVVNDDAYGRKERIVEALMRLLVNQATQR